jgi:hypothetical protein
MATTTSTPTAPAATAAATAPLTRLDRCDRCRAAARVRALLPSGGELLFCGHHAREHGLGLRAAGATLVC